MDNSQTLESLSPDRVRPATAPATLRRWVVRVAVLTSLLVFCVIMLGAWTRLRDAGLGCPDWPTCYGMLTVPTGASDVARANLLYPAQPVEAAKAWPETIHRYFATTLGACITLLAVMGWLGRKDHLMPIRHMLALLALVCVQGVFGALTVTMKLFPPIVTTHLLLGFSTFTLLVLLAVRAARAFPATGNAAASQLLPLAGLGAGVLLVQIALGGWTASNYAAASCTELPVCQSGWADQLDFAKAFQPFGHEAPTYQYAPHLDAAAKLTIHVMHRLGAMATTGVLLVLLALLLRPIMGRRYQRFGGLLALLLAAQIGLGVCNIVFQLPLAVAVAHNAVAALLLQCIVVLTYSLYQERRQQCV